MHETSSFTLFYFITKATCIKTNIHREVLFLQTETYGNSVENVGGFYTKREATVQIRCAVYFPTLFIVCERVGLVQGPQHGQVDVRWDLPHGS